ncbi:hypothetical protein RvY_10458-2 [Ramazzottius varieornatus]|uniref:RGS domain-containing protein n=1 Tax=Ramazzottius varieornatus TaxID=947166 RepID=A0A1D1VI64_RAMVA|nr:hypothetical protein RvY_10458-2 [Ramazzottius varieornatus]
MRKPGSAEMCMSAAYAAILNHLTVRSNPDPPRSSRGGNGTKLEPKAAPQDLELQPTAEDVRLWGESFDNVMATACGRKWFRDFLRCEYSEENILFWLACEDLKKETNPEIVEEKARIIYEDYISILSPKEVSLDSRVREMVNRNMVEPSRHTFDEAQLQIFTLMHRDSYPRFVNSQQYRNLVDKYLKNTAKLQSTNNSAGASTQQQQTQSSSSSNSQQRAGSTG